MVICAVVCAPKILTYLNSGWLFCASTMEENIRLRKKVEDLSSNRPQWPHRNGVFMLKRSATFSISEPTIGIRNHKNYTLWLYCEFENVLGKAQRKE